MLDISPEILTVVMLGGILVAVMTGYPLAFAVGGLTLIIGYLTLGESSFQIIYQRIYSIALNYTLAAVPLFVFMGAMLEKSGIADDLYRALFLWLSGFRGGLAVITVLLGTILAACVGVISASVSMLTLVALPGMVTRGYNKALAAGLCAVSGTLGILIPPSIMLVIYGPMAQVSVGKLFMGAFFPGFLLSFLYMTYVTIRCYLEPELAPTVPPSERAVPFRTKTWALVKSLVPPGLLVLAVLGTIFLGIAPATEAAAIGAAAATVLAVVYRKFTLKVLKEVSLLTLKVTSFAFFIGATSFAFVGVFLSLGCGEALTNIIIASPGGKWGVFFAIQLIIFVLGFFIDWLGILFIIIPIISPIVLKVGFDPVWFGIIVCINLQTAFNTPPLAAALFIVKGTAPPELDVKMTDCIRGVIPFVLLIIVALVLCVAFPEIITWLPSKMIK